MKRNAFSGSCLLWNHRYTTNKLTVIALGETSQPEEHAINLTDHKLVVMLEVGYSVSHPINQSINLLARTL